MIPLLFLCKVVQLYKYKIIKIKTNKIRKRGKKIIKKVFVFDSSILSACYTKELGSAFERMEAMKDKIWFPEYLVKEFKTKKRTDDYYVRLMKRKKISELQRKIARFVFGHPDVISMDLSNDYTSWIFNEAARTHYLIQAFEQYARDNRYGKLQIIFITAVNPDCEFQYGLNFHDYALQPAYRGFKIHFPEESIFPKKCVLPKNLIDDNVKKVFGKIQMAAVSVSMMQNNSLVCQRKHLDIWFLMNQL